MKLVVAAALLSAWTVCAQEPLAAPGSTAPKPETAKAESGQPPLLENSGKPMRVPFQCTDDDMQWAGMSCSEEEPCPAYLEVSAIQQFWFESAKVGDLVIDRRESADSSRYELYGTPNGGETWMIRRTSDTPIAIKRPASDPAGAGWRIRADARTKSFAIEKKQGERWSTAASFLVQIGACKPAPHAAPAPPPPEPAETTPPAPSKPPSLKRPPPKP